MMAAFLHEKDVKACERRACSCEHHQAEELPGAAANEARPPGPPAPPAQKPPIADSEEVLDALPPLEVAGDEPEAALQVEQPPAGGDAGSEHHATDALPAVELESDVADGVADAGSPHLLTVGHFLEWQPWSSGGRDRPDGDKELPAHLFEVTRHASMHRARRMGLLPMTPATQRHCQSQLHSRRDGRS